MLNKYSMNAPRYLLSSRPWHLALLILCLLCLGATLWVGSHIRYIGEPDGAAYADQADALLAGQGMQVGYVHHYYTRFADIRHPEDNYGPGNGVLLAAAFRLFGRSAFAATIPSACLACLLLPLLAFALARRITASPPFAFGCAVSVMFTFLVRRHAFFALVDLPFTACTLAAMLCALRGGLRALLAAGVVLAAACYLKSTGLLLLPIVTLVYYLAAQKPGWRRLAPLAGMWLLCLALLSPWLIRNIHLFGTPFYSANQYVAAGIDYAPHFWATQRWKVWWATPHAELPSLAHVGQVYGWGRVARVVATRLGLAWRIQHLYYLQLVLCLCYFRKRRAIRALTLGIALFVVILCLLFGIESRYLLPMIPLMAAIGWLAYERVLSDVARQWRCTERVSPTLRPWLAPAVVLVLVILFSAPEALHLSVQLGGRLPATPPPRADELEIQASAEWARDHLPLDARCMSQSAFQFRYYSQRLVVMMPWDTPEHFEAVVSHYRVGYLLLCDDYYNSDSRTSRHAYPGVIIAYLQRYAGDWQPIRPPGAPFVLYVHRDVPWPADVPVPEKTMLAMADSQASP